MCEVLDRIENNVNVNEYLSQAIANILATNVSEKVSHTLMNI